MCINKIFLILISFILNLLVFFKTNVLNWGNGKTFPGLILSKIPFNFLKTYFRNYNSRYVFVTGTNGKTSTTSLITHILRSNNYTVITNETGSNLLRGILSTLALSFYKYFKNPPDFVVLEVDEASVEPVLKNFPKKYQLNLIVLNLSRDQLDRYGEIDLLINKVNKVTEPFRNKNIIINNNDYSVPFSKDFIFLKKLNLDTKKIKKHTEDLSINKLPHLVINFNFAYYMLLEILKIKINWQKVKPFRLVEGRGTTTRCWNTYFEIHLTKNPVSFNNNLKLLQNKNVKNVLIYMNDNIPDGFDVSWFYDIDKKLLIKYLNNKNVFLCGTRSYDFYNLLNILNVSSFNFINIYNLKIYSKKWKLNNLFVLSNYSSTQQLVKTINNEKI